MQRFNTTIMKKYRNNGVIGALLDESEYKEFNEGLEKIKVVEPENAQFVNRWNGCRSED